jgi:hypothetical protein
MAKPSNKKDVMKLTGMMVALGRFISKLDEKGVDDVFWYTKHVHYTLVWI